MELLLGCIIGFIITLAIRGFLESFLGGGKIIIRGTDKYKKFQQESDERIRELLKNGSGSSKEELMEWWDKHHKK
jgi:hypothetical protein